MLLDLRRREVRRAPGGAPALLDRGEADQRRQREPGEDQQARLVARGELLGVAEARGEVEPADAARHADQPGHYADLPAEALRHELEHGAVAHAERKHRADEE